MSTEHEHQSPVQKKSGMPSGEGAVAFSPPAFQLKASGEKAPSQAPLQRQPAPADPTVTTISGNQSDAPYGWAYGYDIHFSDTEAFLNIKVKVNADTGVTKEDVAKVQTDTRASFRNIWNKKFTLKETGTDKSYVLNADVQFVDSGEHLAISLKSGSGHDNLSNWYVVSDSLDRAHELGHQLGLKDEYIDPAATNRKDASAPGIYTDNSIMGNYYTEGKAKAEAKERHGDAMASDIGSATGRTFDASVTTP